MLRSMNNYGSAAIGNTTLPVSEVFPPTLAITLDTPSSVILGVQTDWYKVDQLWGGTETMRLAGELYLPKEEAESREQYQKRLNRSNLFNAYKNTIQKASARVFTEDVMLASVTAGTDSIDSETVNPVFKAFSSDVDSNGRNLTNFSKEVFEDAINHGVSFIVVDYTRTPVEGYQNLADERAAGARPYWVHVKATNVLDYRTSQHNGVQKLSLFRYVEFVNELASDGISTLSYRQVRIFKHDPNGGVYFGVYRTTDEQDVWQLVDFGVLPTTGIPVVAVYTNRIGSGLGKPPLMDLADMNIQHWQCYSDAANIHHVANVPFIFIKGITPELDANGAPKPIVISPNGTLITSNKDASAAFVEHSGSAISAGREFIKDLENRMELLGLQLTQRTTSGSQTATEASLNAAETNSRLKSFALSLQDALTYAIAFTAQFLGLPEDTKAVINTRYATDFTSNTTFADVLSSYEKGLIDRDTVVSEAKRRNILDPNAVINEPAPKPELPAVDASQPDPTQV